MEATKNGARVYSYIRFSTPEQTLGDSERRQVDAAKGYAERQGLTLDDSLSLTDRGLSGYHGTHRTKGALGRFLSAVEAGSIPTGSTLVVENIDRLSREGAMATLKEILFKLWDHGITLATLSPEEVYEPGCDSDPRFLALFLYMQRAQNESAHKSERIRASRDQARLKARSEGKLITRRVPEWLDATDATYKDDIRVIPEAAKTVVRIFNQKNDGIGVPRIVTDLNATATWKPRNGWRSSYIKKILKNRAVIGEYQPHLKVEGKRRPDGDPIPNFFPVVVDPTLFHAVQSKLSDNRGSGGRTGKARNLLVGLVKCAYCGGSMEFVDKGKDWQYLVCQNGMRKHCCKRHSVRYQETIDTVLENCRRLKPEQVLPNEDEKTTLCKQLRGRVRGLRAQVDDIEGQIKNYINRLGKTEVDTVAVRYETAIKQLEEDKHQKQQQLDADQRALTEAEQGAESFRSWSNDLTALREALSEEDSVDLRIRLREHLKTFLVRVDVFAEGYAERSHPDDESRGIGEPKQKDDHWEALDAELEAARRAGNLDPDDHQFAEYVCQERMTQRGRFLRLHFRGGAVLDVVPTGSLASGLRLVHGDDGTATRVAVRPDYNGLRREWTKKRRRTANA